MRAADEHSSTLAIVRQFVGNPENAASWANQHHGVALAAPIGHAVQRLDQLRIARARSANKPARSAGR